MDNHLHLISSLIVHILTDLDSRVSLLEADAEGRDDGTATRKSIMELTKLVEDANIVNDHKFKKR